MLSPISVDYFVREICMPERWQFIKERCYYQTLGVTSTATPREIKVAYRTLAKKLHPDLSPGAEPKDLFVRVEEAYAFLECEERRQLYDALGGDVAPKESKHDHLGEDGGLVPPEMGVNGIYLGEFRQEEVVQAQEIIDFKNPNRDSLTLQVLPSVGQFWEARLSEVNDLRLLVRTTVLDGLGLGQHHDVMRVYWQEYPEFFVDVPIHVSVTSSVELPPSTLMKFIRYWIKQKSLQLDRIYSRWDKDERFMFLTLVILLSLLAFVGAIALLDHLIGPIGNPMHQAPSTSVRPTP
jgi:DnaJ domain